MSSDVAIYFPSTLTSDTGPHAVVQETSDVAPDANSNPRLIVEGAQSSNVEVDAISDESLLERLGGGDTEALSILFRRHARTVRNIARKILRHDAEADDLVQDVFIYLFRKATLFKASQGSAMSWIIQVTYHRAFDRRRHLNTRHFYRERDVEEMALAVSERKAEAYFVEWSLEGIWGEETAVRLRELLSPSQLMTIELYFFEGYTLGEIADRLGQTLGNVQHHYYRALEKLRRPDFAEKLRSK